MLVDYKKIPLAMHYLISACYVVVGIMFMTDMFSAIDRWKRMLFGVIVIGYGIFRMYKALTQYRRSREDGE